MSFAWGSNYFSNNLIKEYVLLSKHTVIFQNPMLLHREMLRASLCDFSSVIFCYTKIWSHHQSQCSFNQFLVQDAQTVSVLLSTGTNNLEWMEGAKGTILEYSMATIFSK